MKLPKAALVLMGSLMLLTVGAPIASAAPVYEQVYWTAQPADTYQPGQQYPGYSYGYGHHYGYGYGHHDGC